MVSCVAFPLVSLTLVRFEMALSMCSISIMFRLYRVPSCFSCMLDCQHYNPSIYPSHTPSCYCTVHVLDRLTCIWAWWKQAHYDQVRAPWHQCNSSCLRWIQCMILRFFIGRLWQLEHDPGHANTLLNTCDSGDLECRLSGMIHISGPHA